MPARRMHRWLCAGLIYFWVWSPQEQQEQINSWMFTSLCGLGDALLVTKQQHPLQNSHFRSRVGQHTARYLYMQLGEHLTSATFLLPPHVFFHYAQALLYANRELMPSLDTLYKRAKPTNMPNGWQQLLSSFAGWYPQPMRRCGANITSIVSFQTV